MSFSTFKDCHESWDAHGLIQGNGSSRVAPIRPGGVCKVLDLVESQRNTLERRCSWDLTWTLYEPSTGFFGGLIEVCHL